MPPPPAHYAAQCTTHPVHVPRVAPRNHPLTHPPINTHTCTHKHTAPSLPCQLGWVVGEEGNLLVADPVATSRPDRERLAALVFETFNATAFFVADQVGVGAAIYCLMSPVPSHESCSAP